MRHLRALATAVKTTEEQKWLTPSSQDIEKTADEIATARLRINEAFKLRELMALVSASHRVVGHAPTPINLRFDLSRDGQG
jgi:hypothetical protein